MDYQGPKTIPIYPGDVAEAAHPDYVKWLEAQVAAATTPAEPPPTTAKEVEMESQVADLTAQLEEAGKREAKLASEVADLARQLEAATAPKKPK